MKSIAQAARPAASKEEAAAAVTATPFPFPLGSNSPPSLHISIPLLYYVQALKLQAMYRGHMSRKRVQAQLFFSINLFWVLTTQ